MDSPASGDDAGGQAGGETHTRRVLPTFTSGIMTYMTNIYLNTQRA